MTVFSKPARLKFSKKVSLEYTKYDSKGFSQQLIETLLFQMSLMTDKWTLDQLIIVLVMFVFTENASIYTLHR